MRTKRLRLPRVASLAGLNLLAISTVLGLVGVGLLAYDHVHRLSTLAVAPAVATLLAVVVRTAMTFRENQSMLERIRRQAVSDELTGIGNRRKLMHDLEGVFASGPAAETILLLFDLDGFKGYNDTYGHPAGDALLARLGRKLEAAVSATGTGYRLGGDEFCVLGVVPAGGPEPLIEASAAALSEGGEAFSVGASFGAVFLPEEADSPSQALRIADQRLYANKQGRRLASGRQPEDLLLRAMYEREPRLAEHAHTVKTLAAAVGERLGFCSEELSELVRAAELHDIGKLAIPDAILRKPGPLSDEDMQFVRRHTAIGERILSASPALGAVARLVRASHERWDGEGYPDGLAGEAIPVGARIITVCDAFTAMQSERPYRAPKTADEALDEIRRCAGSQFDPVIAQVFLDIVGSEALAPAGSPPVVGFRPLPKPATAAR